MQDERISQKLRICFRLLPGQESIPGAGELYLRPRKASPRFDHALALLALERGPTAFAHGAGPLHTIVAQANPTLDDMLAVLFVERAVAGTSLPAGCRAFALHAAEVREGLKSTRVPLHESLEGIYLAIRAEAGPDLSDEDSHEHFLAAWHHVAKCIISAAEAGHDPHAVALFSDDPEYFRARAYLAHDREVYRMQDLPRGERWAMLLPPASSACTGLILRQPQSRLWKYWAREDSEAQGGQGYVFLGVYERNNHWRFSTDPVRRWDIGSLATLLQEKEIAADPAGAATDPWYDGGRHRRTLVAAPHAGTRLSEQQVLEVVRQWGSAQSVAVTGASHLASCPGTGTVPENAVEIAHRCGVSGPRHIGKYPVIKELGGGGQARVYLCIHPTLDVQVAVKLGLPKTAATCGTSSQVRNEGRILAELAHPNLARVYDLDFHDDRVFLVMEYVPGQNLAQVAKNRRFTPFEAAGLVAQVARAVDCLHKRGIVHQDIKPHNVILDERGHPRLIDFGLAQVRHAWSGDADLPQGGTPAFMAPEQARGDIDQIGPASDVFAIAGMLYFLLTGEPPFTGKNIADVLERAREGEVDCAPLRNAGVSRRLQKICLHGMATSASARHADALAMAQELEQFMRRCRKA